MFLSSDHILQVSEITELIKSSLERDFCSISVEGEISNYRPASSGHCYFSLKDNDAILSSVIFRQSAMRLRFKPTDGMKVIATGRLSVYKQRGNYQIICDTMKPAGQGSILQILEERKQRLAAEGLFDQSRKKSLPAYPHRIGVITSPTGAAIRDILNVLKRRNPTLSVVIYPAAVQGENAAEEIAEQIDYANAYPITEVLIIGRGGGSLEDLLAFSDESVVRAVANSGLPIISAVGHEIDLSLSDFAADLRAPTPSAAAELVTPDFSDLMNRINILKKELPTGLINKVEILKERVSHCSAGKLKESFNYYLEPRQLQIDDYRDQLIHGISELCKNNKHRLQLAHNQLIDLSPLNLLQRGFAYVTDKEGKNINHADQVTANQLLSIEFYKGKINAEVKEIYE